HDTHLVWLVQWFSPSQTDPHGGKNLFAYMESANGRAPSFWAGESAEAELPTRAPGFTYPGVKRVKGSYTRTAPGTITIEVPMSDAYAANPVSRTLLQRDDQHDDARRIRKHSGPAADRPRLLRRLILQSHRLGTLVRLHPFVTSPAAGSFRDVNHRLRPLHFLRVVRPGDSSHEGVGKPRKPAGRKADL